MRALTLLALVSGLSAQLLLFVGLKSIPGLGFDLIWFTHIAFQLLAAVLSLLCFTKLCLESGSFGAFIFFVATLFLALTSAECLLPITEKDALIYHLAVPKLWLKAGGIVNIPWHEWSYFPMLTELGYLGLLKFKLDWLCNFYHLSFLVITCGVLQAFLQSESSSNRAALTAFCLPLSIPLFIKLGASALSDLALAEYFAICFCQFILHSKHLLDRGHLVLSGIAMGLCLSTKYNALLTFALFVPCSLLYLQAKAKAAVIDIFVFALIALLVFCPWPLKNFLWTQNPFYPFLQSWFGGSSHDIAFLGSVKPLMHRAQVYGESWWQIALIPVRFFFSGQDNDAANFDGVLSPVLLAFLFLFTWRSKPEWLNLSLGFVVLYLGFSLLLFHALVRYQMPSLIILCLLSALVLGEATPRFSLLPKLILIFHFIFAFLYCLRLADDNDSLAFLNGTLDKERYLQQHLTEYNSIAFINHNLPAGSKTYLLLTGNRYFYFDRNVRGGYFSGEAIVEELKRDQSASDLLKFFLDQDIDHLMLNAPRTQALFKDSLTPKEELIWQEFFNQQLQILFKDGPNLVARIKGPKAAIQAKDALL